MRQTTPVLGVTDTGVASCEAATSGTLPAPAAPTYMPRATAGRSGRCQPPHLRDQLMSADGEATVRRAHAIRTPQEPV